MDGRKIDPPLTLYRVALDQASVASSFLASPALRPAIITIWVASFGAALHMPCTTYYYRVVGASDVDIGAINMVATVGSLVLGPVYGHVLDTRGPFVPVVVSCAFCALGCALRGAANSVAMLYFAAFVLGIGGSNLWTTVLGLVVKRSPCANRSVAVSGYLVQVALLRLGGKLLYNPLDWALSAFTHWTVVRRYRAIMSICTIFCFFGVFELVRSRAAIALEPEPSSAGAAASAASMDADAAAEATAEERAPLESAALDGAGEGGGGGAAVESGGGAAAGADARSSGAAALGAIIALRGAVAAAGATLWPLYVADAFGWSAREFASLVVASSLAATGAVAAAPSLERSYGARRVASAASAAAALASLGGFHKSAPPLLHALAATLFTAAVAMLDPLLKSLASDGTAKKTIAASFGMLATLDGVGSMVGSLGGAWLYSAAGLSAPFFASAALLGSSAVAILRC